MPLKSLQKVKCSLDLGYIYSVNYSFTPQQGIRITLFFVNENGVYKKDFINPTNPRKVQITIGSTVLSVYPIKKEFTNDGNQKVLKVDFIDDTVRLNSYYIGLTGKACGENIYQLGKAVDKRTAAEKNKEDPDLFKIKQFTQDDDVEYTFNDFIKVLRKVFVVKTTLQIDNEITRPFTGTFAEVLNAWCSYFSYSYFFENGSLTIFDPLSLNIEFPAIPEDAIEFSETESIENTYDKTVWVNFYQDGEPISIDTGDDSSPDGNLFIASESLSPWENIFNIKRLNEEIHGSIDINQVAAAQYGKEFWFLYNYSQGTEGSVCGFDRYAASPAIFSAVEQQLVQQAQNVRDSLGVNKDIAAFDEKLFEEKFAFYYNYGRNIAGRYYVSDLKTSFKTFNLYDWYDQNGGQSFTIGALKQRERVDANFFTNPAESSYGFISDSVVEGFKGVALSGQRIYVKDNDNRDYDLYFSLTDAQKQEIAAYFKQIFGNFGSDYIQWTDGVLRSYVIYEKIALSPEIQSIIDNISSRSSGLGSPFLYRYDKFNMKGFFNKIEDTKVKKRFSNSDIQDNSSPTVVSNTALIKIKKDSDFVAYCKKYNKCFNQSTNMGLLNRRFESISPSIDIPIPIEVKKNAKNVVKVNRNTKIIDKYVNSGILSQLAKPFLIPEKTLSFSLNYFYESVPVDFVSSGLVGLSLSISENGVTTTYSYSNQILQVPVSAQLIEKLERTVKSSWIRTYRAPKQSEI